MVVKSSRLLLVLVLVVGVLFSMSFVVAYNCWDYDDDETTCDSKSDCTYHSESWGGWCEQLNCWSLWSQTDCENTTLTADIDKDCQWKSASDWGWCMQTSCWSFKDTNESYCENSSANGGLNCEWNAQCNGWNEQVDCWSLGEVACGATAGCSWGECMDVGCWNYETSDTCAAATGSMGNDCVWSSTGGYCYEPSCWDYSGSSYNESYCENVSARGTTCIWVDNAYQQDQCVEPSCWLYDFTNESVCTSASLNGNLSCSWDGQYCMMGGCMSYGTSATCDAASGCSWETGSGSGWCEEFQCWSFDSWQNGNETYCVNSSLNGGLSCEWYNDSIADDGTGWCQTDMGDTTCANFTNDKDCMDTYYCWWQWADWSDTSGGGTCEEPGWGVGDYEGIDTIFVEWNPGCYIFDMNSTDCEKVVGCDYVSGQCADAGDEDNGIINVSASDIETNGLNCSMINDSQLCNNIPALSTCCEWVSGVCSSKLGKSCWENADMEQQGLGIKACGDVGVQTSTAGEGETLCQQIAGYPLYMPCVWSNTTKTCNFKSTEVFGNRTQSFALIENKKNCEAANGKWIQEFYCEGNRSIPAGRCEQKGSDERNCDKACFACDYTFNGAAHNSSRVAKEYCYDSDLGYCKFTADASAPNGFGTCRAKAEFVGGSSSDCRSDCGSCTYFGNPNASTYSDARPDLTPPIPTTFDICNTPKCYCEYAKEFNNVACKWVADASSTDIGGYCVDNTEKTCADSCDRCYTQDNCLDVGRSALNGTGSCEWSTDTSTCSKRSGSDGVAEVCWDGIDNDGDALIDCADSACYADSFCGFVSGDCFGWLTQATCEAAQLDSGLNCTWVSDAWGSWCDFPGMNCWQSDGNEAACNLKNATCDWFGGNSDSGGWCEQDWSVGSDCYNLMSESTCVGGTNCTWTNDTWCDGEGSDNTWCTDQGGWCDPAGFAPKNCWVADNTNETYCTDQDASCYYDGTWCMEQGCWNYDGNESACGDASGCSWESNDWGSMCEVDWSANCWQFNVSTCAVNNCSWRTDTWGGWCDNKFAGCWDLAEGACDDSANCFWNEWMWNWQTNTQGSCDATCFDPDISDATCAATSGCRLSTGWCMSDSMGGSMGGADCWQFVNDSYVVDGFNCSNSTECRWKNEGWCNPKGFSGGGASTGMGGGASTGMDCWKYDGNQTRCEDSSDINMSCVWMEEFRPFCEPDWSSDCWMYYDNITADANGYVCGNQTGCMWNADQSYCMNVFDECWNNPAYSNDTNSSGAGSTSGIACNANANCNWTDGSWDSYYSGDGWCEPAPFKADTEAACNALGNAKWMSGWCSTPGMYEMFGGMEMGAPVMIAMDAMGDNTTAGEYLDLMGVGMKDMDDSYGFGSGTVNFANAGICNNQKIWSSTGNNFGQGNKTVRYYVYLDTDGSTTGGCALSDDSSAVGYEFLFTYKSTYNATLGKATEVFNAKKCSSGGWVTADISLSAWKEKMCGEIQGPMIAVDKAALEKFPILYDASADMRVYVSIAGADNNASSPSDNAGPGWVTPGAVDFPITGFFELGASSATFEGILMGGGYVKGEDCYNLVDDDKDALIDCNDWDCEFASHCDSTGVNAVGYVDSSMPVIKGIKVEEYPDAALIMFDTNKPTNGTLTFYYNDSTCSTLNDTIYDSTIVSSVRNYTSWHYTSIYNDAGLNSLNYSLSADTSYYYKLKVCDSGGKCSVSACSSFRTAESATKCGYCNFVTIISPPSGWTVYYDLNTNGTYEHIQGQMCGPKAGMKTNYSTGRKANVKMVDATGAEFIFLNATITKTGLTGNTRRFSSAGDLIHNASLTDSAGAAVEMVGMASATRDKIVNNLHPEVCQVKIPNDDCSELWYCDDSGDNCIRRDNAALNAPTGVASGTSCLWTIPYCEF